MKRYLTSDDTPKTEWSPPVSWFFSRVCWREIGRRLPHHPELIDSSLRYVEQVLGNGEYTCSPRYLEQWKTLLEKGVQPVVDVLMSPDDNHSQVLRSCTPPPIRQLLSPNERDLLLTCVRREVKEMRKDR